MSNSRHTTPVVARVASALVWLWRLFKAWIAPTLSVASTVFSIIWASYGANIWVEGAWAFWVAAALAVLSIVARVVVQRPSYMELAAQKERATSESDAKSRALQSALTVLLRQLAEYCGFASNSDRVSAYFFHDEQFVMLARWSTHPINTQAGRGTYPAGQGAIGEAWDRGFALVSLPSTRPRWERALESKHGFEAGSARALRMHSQSIIAQRIEHEHHAVGVLVFESLDGNRADQAILEKIMDSRLYATLSELVGSVAAMTPGVEQATATRPRQSDERLPWKKVPPAPEETSD